MLLLAVMTASSVASAAQLVVRNVRLIDGTGAPPREGVSILVAFWDKEEDTEGVKALLDMVRADAYVTTLQEAVDVCVDAATGALEIEPHPAAPAAIEKPKRPPAVTPPPRKPKGKKPQTAPV